jgi:flagellar basal-body rod protein FlgB
MSDPLQSVTTAALSLALDAASLRHQAIAANIANHGTQGYVPQKVDFAAQMQEARRSLEATGRIDPAALANVRVDLQPLMGADGLPAQVHIDQEMADLAQNSVQFQALAKGLARHLSILSTAVNDGKR